MVIKEGYITLTPLHRDLTAYAFFEEKKILNAIKAVHDENI
jgi:hypothetical protein